MEIRRVKRYVTVNADYMADGTVFPHSVMLDGQLYPVDRIVRTEKIRDSGPARERICFHIIVKGVQTKLYLEDGRWYVGKKV